MGCVFQVGIALVCCIKEKACPTPVMVTTHTSRFPQPLLDSVKIYGPEAMGGLSKAPQKLMGADVRFDESRFHAVSTVLARGVVGPRGDVMHAFHVALPPTATPEDVALLLMLALERNMAWTGVVAMV